MPCTLTAQLALAAPARRNIRLHCSGPGFADSLQFGDWESVMAKSKTSKRYTPEFRRQMVELVRAGRKPQELSKEFGPTAWSICLWVKQADRDVGRDDGGLTTSEREELRQLRRDN